MKKKRILALLLLLAGLLAVGAWLADRKLKSLRHPGLPKFIGQWFTNYPASFRVEPQALHIRIEQRDMDRLKHMVEEARERGVILPEGREYVPAVVEGPDGEFKARIRIKGKMTDHVKGSKWSFRVQARKDGGFQGMQRFSLQHPGTRNYLTDWFFHRLMSDEGSIALRYGFIRLHFNGEDLGIYAYEEHFGPELLAHNGRVEGPLFRFDPSLFWEHRLNEMRKLRFDEPFGAYQAASVDAFSTGSLARDTVARAQFEEAVSLIEAFRRGRLRAAQVFDADRLGLRHAVLDLVGGHHSLDWSDVKFYYDPILKRVEPVAYESFSAFRIRSLAGSHRYVGHTTPAMDLHDAYFNDPDVFRAYVHHLERVSRKSYLDSVFHALGPALDSASAIVYQEFPYKELDRSIYYHNQRVIRKLLDVPKGFHAHDHGLQRDTLTVMAVPIEGLPIEVHGMVAADGSLLPPVGGAIIPVRQKGHPGRPLALRFHVPDSSLLPRLKDRRIAYSVLGGSVRKELDVFNHRLYEDLELAPQRLERSVDMRSWPFVEVDEATRTVYLRPGSWKLDGDLVIPEGYQVKGTAPLRIDLVKGARVISRSPIELQGYEDAQVVLASSDSSGGGVLVYGTSGPSKWEHVRSEGFGPAERGRASLVFQDAPLVLRQCTLAEHRSRDLLHVVRGQARILGSMLVGGRDQVVVAHASLRLSNSSLLGAGDDGLVVHGGVVSASGTTIDGAVGIALKVDAGGELEGQELHLRSGGRAVLVAEAGRVVLRNGSVRTPGIGIDVKDGSPRHGGSNVVLEGMTIEAGKEPIRAGRGNKVQQDGRVVQAGESSDVP
jgi:hypothetical protein